MKRALALLFVVVLVGCQEPTLSAPTAQGWTSPPSYSVEYKSGERWVLFRNYGLLADASRVAGTKTGNLTQAPEWRVSSGGVPLYTFTRAEVGMVYPTAR